MIDNAPAIAACLENINSAIAETDWRLENDATPQKEMLLFEELVEKIDFINKIRDIISFIPYGWSALEIIYDKTTKNLKFPIVELLTIRQETLENWSCNEDGKIVGLKRFHREKTIPIQKLVHFRDAPNRGNVEGSGMLRSCFIAFKILEELKRGHVEQQKCSISNLVKVSVPIALLNYGSQQDSQDKIHIKNAQQTIFEMGRIIESLSRGKATS